MKTPMNVPSIVPRPPNRLAPPITTAVMTTRLSSGWPEIVVVLKYPRFRIPARPASSPLSAYTLIRCRSTLMPARSAASGLEPIA